MNKVFKETKPLLIVEFGKEKTAEILKHACKEYQKLVTENATDCKEVKAHTEKIIYPCISMYIAMIKVGIERIKAVSFLDFSYSKRAEKGANSLKNLLKIGGLYKKYPAMFKWVAKNQFGVKAGFEAKFYDTEKTRVKFDMTKCLYCEVCKKYHCEELIVCFCHTDDVNNANLHEKLCWNRTKIMGEGADLCDFDLFVKEDK